MNIVNIFIYFCPSKIKYKIEGNVRYFQPKNTFTINMQLLYASITFSIPLPLFSTSFPFTFINKAIECDSSFWPVTVDWNFISPLIMFSLHFFSVFSMSSSNSSPSFVILRTSFSGLGHENTCQRAATMHDTETWSISTHWIGASSASVTSGLPVSAFII